MTGCLVYERMYVQAHVICIYAPSYLEVQTFFFTLTQPEKNKIPQVAVSWIHFEQEKQTVCEERISDAYEQALRAYWCVQV